MSFYKWLPLILVLFFVSCSRKKGNSEHSFYNWKTSFSDDTTVRNKITNMGVQHFYLHYFDVDWNEALHMPVPKGEVTDYYTLPQAVSKYTPVIFITNRTFEQISPAWCDTLAVKITKRMQARTDDLERNYVSAYIYKDYETHEHSIPAYELIEKLTADSVRKIVALNTEVQIDCDWTPSTRAKYFRFLEKFRELNHSKIISATIRLYPYKYKETMGVPPVDRGMLMCYNMGSITSPGTKNSVFDIGTLKSYLSAGKYPLPLDIALPSFGWHVWFRAGKYKGIVHGGDALEQYGGAFKKSGNVYKVAMDTVINNNYYREGDELRAELPDDGDLEKAADLLTSKLPDYTRIVFFDWSDLSTTRYEKVIKQVFSRY